MLYNCSVQDRGTHGHIAVRNNQRAADVRQGDVVNSFTMLLDIEWVTFS